MARRPRLCLPQHPHLVLQRAAAGVDAFVDDADYQAYLQRLAAAAPKRGVQIHGWALLPGAAWLLLTPADCAGLSTLMQELARSASRTRSPGLWDGRFRSALLQPGPLVLQALLAVDQVAALDGVVADAAAWRYSSLAHHAGGRADALLREAAEYWALGNTPYAREAAFRAELAAGTAARAWPRLRAAVLGGVALGDAAFLDGAAQALGRAVSSGRRGRPRRAVQSVPN